MPNAIALLPPDVALALSAARTRELFEAFGAPRHAPADIDDAIARARALWRVPVPAALAFALDDVACVGLALVRDAIPEASLDVRGARAGSGDPDETAPDAAARLVLRVAKKDDSAARILRRARLRIAQCAPSPASYELTSPCASPRANAERALPVAAREVHGTSLVACWTVGEGDATHLVAVHALPREGLVAADREGKLVPAPRGLGVDLVCVEERRVVVSPARATRMAAWSEALGRALHADPRAFDEAPPAFTLKPLMDGGAQTLARAKLPAPVTRVRVIGCRREDEARLSVRSADALSDLLRRVSPGGYLAEATLRVDVDGAREPVDVRIDLPNRIAIAPLRHEREARAAMTALGLAAPGARPDDLVACAPWQQPDWRWRAMVGDRGFEELASAKALRRVTTRLPADASLRKYGSLFVSFPLKGEDGAAYAVPDDWGVRARTVSADAGARWELQIETVCARLREKLELEAGDALDLPDAVAGVGLLRAGSTRVRFVTLVRPVAPGQEASTARAARRACRAAHVVMLVPKGRSLGGVLPEIEISTRQQLGLDDVEGVVARAAEEAGVDAALDGWRWATRSAPLVILEEREEAWLGRARLSQITDNQWRMLRALAGHAGQWMNVKVLGEKISPGATIPDQVVRKTRGDFDARVKKSLRGAGLPATAAKGIVESDPRRGYRLGVGVVVR